MIISMFALSDAVCEVITYGYPNVLDFNLGNEGMWIQIDAYMSSQLLPVHFVTDRMDGRTGRRTAYRRTGRRTAYFSIMIIPFISVEMV